MKPWYDSLLEYSCVSSVMRDPRTGEWQMWGAGSVDRSRSDEGMGVTAYRSADGFYWQPRFQYPPVDRSATPKASHIVFSGEHSAHGAPFFDARYFIGFL